MLQTSTTTPPRPLEEVLQDIQHLSTIPQIAIRVMEISQDPEPTVADLAAIVESDAPLAVKVLRMVNSAAYAVRAEVKTLEQAVAMLGFNQIRNLAVTLSVSKVFQNPQIIGCYNRQELWRHLVAVGICSRLVAASCRLPDAEDAFLAGLLHDLGIIIEDQYLHQHFCLVLAAMNESTSLVQTEQQVLGFDHTMIAHRISRRWNFPPKVQAAIRHHHASHEYKGPDAAIVRCVEVANFLCTIQGISSVGMKLVQPPREAVQAMGLNRDVLQTLLANTTEELDRHSSLFELPQLARAAG